MSTIFDDNIDKTSKAVTKILRQTQERAISWKIDSRRIVLGAEEYVNGKIYTTTVLDKYLRLYKYKQKLFSTFQDFDWDEGIKLQFIDSDGNTEWEFPYSNAISDLYKTVSFQLYDVEKFLDTLLND